MIDLVQQNMFNKDMLHFLWEWMKHERTQVVLWFILVVFLMILLLLALGGAAPVYDSSKLQRPMKKKKLWLAWLLSLFVCGLGRFYNGHILKGWVRFLIVNSFGAKTQVFSLGIQPCFSGFSLDFFSQKWYTIPIKSTVAESVSRGKIYNSSPASRRGSVATMFLSQGRPHLMAVGRMLFTGVAEVRWASVRPPC